MECPNRAWSAMFSWERCPASLSQTLAGAGYCPVVGLFRVPAMVLLILKCAAGSSAGGLGEVALAGEGRLLVGQGADGVAAQRSSIGGRSGCWGWVSLAGRSVRRAWLGQRGQSWSSLLRAVVIPGNFGRGCRANHGSRIWSRASRKVRRVWHSDSQCWAWRRISWRDNWGMMVMSIAPRRRSWVSAPSGVQ